MMHIAMFKKNKHDSPFSQYQDTTDSLSNKNLTLGYWFVQHKVLLYQIVIGILLTVSISTIGYSLYGWGRYLAVDYWRDKHMYQQQTLEFIDYTNLQPLYSAIALQYDTVRVFESSEGRYDFVTPVTNHNERFIAYITYHYTYADGQTASNRLMLLPGYAHLLPVFGEELSRSPGNVQLVIEHITWNRINPHQIASVRDFLDERNSFLVDDLRFHPASASLGISTAGVSFTIKNNTLYQYWEPVFYAALKQGNQIVGVIQVSFDSMDRKESKDVTVRFLSRISSVDAIDIYPVIDIFDPRSYIAF